MRVYKIKTSSSLSRWTYFLGIPLSVGLAVALLFVVFMRDCKEGIGEREIQFSVRAPKAVPSKRIVKEMLPLLNYVFFEEGSTEIPNRYMALTKAQAATFNEGQLGEFKPNSLTGRSIRQMAAYYNILNILGDRMKKNPRTAILLTGSSGRGLEHGKARAETVKRYLVDIFGIDID